MMNMGFKPGKGLGKFEHGRTVPVEASAQKGRRGLGAKPSAVGALPQDIKEVGEEAKPEAREEVVSEFIVHTAKDISNQSRKLKTILYS